MTDLALFAMPMESAPDGMTVDVRIMPWNEVVPLRFPDGEVRKVSYRPGSITVDMSDPPALRADHSGGVLSNIGKLVSYHDTGQALVGSFRVSDTSHGRDFLTLVADGVISDVSGSVPFPPRKQWVPGRDGVVAMSGTLDHVASVDSGAFGKKVNPSKVLAVHEREGAKMPDVNEEAAPVVAEYDDSATVATLAEFRSEIERLNTVVDDLTPPVNPLAEFSGEEIFTALLVRRHGGEIANHALADVIGDLGADDASGLAPDTYWGAGLQHKIDRRRPLFAVTGSAPFPDTGYNLDVPKVTQEVLVAKRGAEKSEANTRALQVENNPYPIVWFDGAVDVAREIISQSSPSVLSIIDDSFRNGWAVATEADTTDIAGLAATHTGAALDFTTYGALVADIITTSDLIEDATGLPGDRLAVTSAQWIGILSLMDGGDRRQFSMMNPSNADGSGSLLTRGIDVGGVFIFRAPAASVALQFNSDSLKTAEKSPMQLMAENVANIGVDVGVWGGTVTVTWAEGIYSYEIVS